MGIKPLLELVDDEDHLGTFGSANPFCSLGQSEFRWQFGDSLVQLPQYPLLGLLRGRFDIDCDHFRGQIRNEARFDQR